MFILLEAILLGIIEGLTEFLPVSSTGHLIIFGYALGFADAQEIFTVVVQLGAIAAIIWFLRHDIIKRTTGLFRGDASARRFWTLLVIGTLPACIAGLFLNSAVEHLATPTVVAYALIAGGLVLWAVDRKPVTKTAEPEVNKITLKQSLLIGLGQCLALMPGVSRSGATIISGLAVGIDRPTATVFSFYLSIPVLVLASGYKLVAHSDGIAAISGGPAAILLGMAAAFVTALVAVAWLLKYVSHHNFKPFAYYRIALGVLILLALAIF